MLAPKVAIVITTYFEKNKKYLDLCIESINNLNYPQERIEIIVVARPTYIPMYPGVNTVYPPEDDFTNARGMNYGFKAAALETEFFLYLNDDVFLTRDCLLNLIMSVGNAPRMANAISPCDNGGTVNLSFGFFKDNQEYKIFGQYFKYENLQPFFKELMNAGSFYRQGDWIRPPFLCMFATLIPRKVYEMIGEFDEVYKTGQDDLDYCKRASAIKVDMIMCLDAVAWHFGGVTSAETITAKSRLNNIKHFREKWGHLPTFVTQESIDHFEKGEEWDTFVHKPEGTEAGS